MCLLLCLPELVRFAGSHQPDLKGWLACAIAFVLSVHLWLETPYWRGSCRSTSGSGMASQHPAADLEGAAAQPFTAGSRPVDWLQANRAWRNVSASDEQSLPRAPGASRHSSTSQPGHASNWSLPHHFAQPAAGPSNAVPFTSTFPYRGAADDRQDKRKFQPDAERTKAAGLSGSSLLFSNSSSSHAPQSFLRKTGLSEPQSKPCSQAQASAMPSAADGMQDKGGPSSLSIHTSVPAGNPLSPNAARAGMSGDSMPSHHGQKRSASAASLGTRPRDGLHDPSAASNGNVNHASSTDKHGWAQAPLQDHLNASPGNFAAHHIPEQALFEAGSSRPSSASVQPQAGAFKWPQPSTAQAPTQSSQAASRLFSANSASALDPFEPGSIRSSPDVTASSTAGSTDRLPGRVSRAGWSGISEKAPVAAAAAPASSVNAVGQPQQDQALRNAGPAAGAGRSQGMTGAAKDPFNIQAPFVFGSTGTPRLPSQVIQIMFTLQNALVLSGCLLL